AFSSDYCLSLGENKENNHLLIDPNLKGNITRFFQHSFEKNSGSLGLYHIKTDRLSLANLKLKTFLYKTYPIVIFYSKKKIKPNEMLSFDYHFSECIKSGYWSYKNNSPFLFNRFGHILKSPSEYEVTHICLSISPASKVFTLEIDACVPLRMMNEHI